MPPSVSSGLKPRDPQQTHRAATPLELFFDLCFVVAIAVAAAQFHHAIAEDHFGEGARSYAMVFFAIWWAWMNFTWFASAYDSDDWGYRLGVFVQMAGVLVIGAGIPRAFKYGDFSIAAYGYTIIRIGLIPLWLRAAVGDPERRTTCLRYAIGLALVQAGWLAALKLPAGTFIFAFFGLLAVELLIPVWAESYRTTPWHRHHIAERYGLLTLIVLGESVLASSMAIGAVLTDGVLTQPLVLAIVGGLLILFSMWWIYFEESAHNVLTSNAQAFQWGYAHYLIFGCAAAVGGGLAAYADVITDHAHVDKQTCAMGVTIPVAVFVILVWWLHCRKLRSGALTAAAFFLTAVAISFTPLLDTPILATGGLLSLLVTYLVFTKSGGRGHA